MPLPLPVPLSLPPPLRVSSLTRSHCHLSSDPRSTRPYRPSRPSRRPLIYYRRGLINPSNPTLRRSAAARGGPPRLLQLQVPVHGRVPPRQRHRRRQQRQLLRRPAAPCQQRGLGWRRRCQRRQRRGQPLRTVTPAQPHRRGVGHRQDTRRRQPLGRPRSRRDAGGGRRGGLITGIGGEGVNGCWGRICGALSRSPAVLPADWCVCACHLKTRPGRAPPLLSLARHRTSIPT